jgi:uncharacterized protein (DUF885 family)
MNFHQITNEAEARNYISRLSKVNGLMDQLIVQLQLNEKQGAVLSKFLFP